MRNRDLMEKKLTNVEGIFTSLLSIVNTSQPIESYRININKGLSLIEDIKSLLDLEPMSPNEYNNKR